MPPKHVGSQAAAPPSSASGMWGAGFASLCASAHAHSHPRKRSCALASVNLAFASATLSAAWLREDATRLFSMLRFGGTGAIFCRGDRRLESDGT